jgi:hypothetical protein
MCSRKHHWDSGCDGILRKNNENAVEIMPLRFKKTPCLAYGVSRASELADSGSSQHSYLAIKEATNDDAP